MLKEKSVHAFQGFPESLYVLHAAASHSWNPMKHSVAPLTRSRFAGLQLHFNRNILVMLLWSFGLLPLPHLASCLHSPCASPFLQYSKTQDFLSPEIYWKSPEEKGSCHVASGHARDQQWHPSKFSLWPCAFYLMTVNARLHHSSRK